MKNSSFAFISLILLFTYSCKKNADNLQFLPKTEPLNWCDDKIACWGDSFTEGPGGWPYPLLLARALKKDSLVLYSHSLLHGDSAVFNGGVSGQTSIQIRERFMEDTIHRRWSTIIWAGRNNSWDTAQVAHDIDIMVTALGHQKYFVIGLLNGDWPNEWEGTDYYNNVTSFNLRMAVKYKKHFLDVKPYLQKYATNSREDSMCLVHDVTPSSLRLDELHLSPLGYQYIANDIVENLSQCK